VHNDVDESREGENDERPHGVQETGSAAKSAVKHDHDPQLEHLVVPPAIVAHDVEAVRHVVVAVWVQKA